MGFKFTTLLYDTRYSIIGGVSFRGRLSGRLSDEIETTLFYIGVELVQNDVGQQRGDNSTLRNSPVGSHENLLLLIKLDVASTHKFPVQVKQAFTREVFAQ